MCMKISPQTIFSDSEFFSVYSVSYPISEQAKILTMSKLNCQLLDTNYISIHFSVYCVNVYLIVERDRITINVVSFVVVFFYLFHNNNNKKIP